MATRQYIGARYVPKFFEGGSNLSAEWLPNTQYEALTIVTRNGNSYTSRKPVPASIGAPELNPQYWVSTGIYNQQVEQYRQAVLGLENSFDAFVDRTYSTKPVGMNKVIIISDSYGLRQNERIFNTLINKLALANGEYYTGALGSIGFAHANDGQTFLTLFNSITANLSEDELSEITHVIVVGGANDITETETNITNAINTFYNSVRAICTNSKVYIGFCGVNFDWAKAYSIGNTCAIYRKASKFPYKCVYLSGIEYVLHNKNYLEGDGVHPNANGCDALAGGIYQALVGGKCDVAYPMINVGTIGNTQSRNIYMRLDNNEVELFTNNFSHITYDSNQTIVANGSNAFDLVTLNDMGYACGDGYQSNGENIIIYAKQASAATYTEIQGYLEYSNGVIKWHPILFGSSSATPGTIAFNELYIPRFNLRMSTCWN